MSWTEISKLRQVLLVTKQRTRRGPEKRKCLGPVEKYFWVPFICFGLGWGKICLQFAEINFWVASAAAAAMLRTMTTMAMTAATTTTTTATATSMEMTTTATMNLENNEKFKWNVCNLCRVWRPTSLKLAGPCLTKCEKKKQHSISNPGCVVVADGQTDNLVLLMTSTTDPRLQVLHKLFLRRFGK